MAIGKVIKSEPGETSLVGADRPGVARRPVMNAEVYDAKQQANAIIAEAQRQAQEILARAQEERQKTLAEGREEGKQEGLKAVNEVLARAHLIRGELLRQGQPQMLELALKIAEKIIGRDLERDPRLLVDICANAIENVRNAKQMVVRVNPKAAAVLRERKAELLQAIGRSVDLAIKEDGDVEALGCVIQTEFGTIDAQLMTQMQMLQNLLLPTEGRKEGPQ
jgi:type III secretion protein L